MTATMKPPSRGGTARARAIRFSSMESLGFSNSSSTWSDTPIVMPPARPRGRHLARPDSPAPTARSALADRAPEDVGERLGGGNIRWGSIALVTVLMALLAATGWWLYQRFDTDAQVTSTEVADRATALETVLPALETFNEALLDPDPTARPADLFVVETAARELFEVSGALPDDESASRLAATTASGATLDAVRVAGDALAYRLAVVPVLATPDLETDPTLIGLDDAARAFGDWQLRFDEVRSALPEDVLAEVTGEIDVLSEDLAAVMGDYVDALRLDDATAAATVITGLSERLMSIEDVLIAGIAASQEAVSGRIGEIRNALADLGA